MAVTQTVMAMLAGALTLHSGAPLNAMSDGKQSGETLEFEKQEV